MAPSSSERRIALFIDFENLVTNTGFTAANFDLQPSLDRLLEQGKVIFRRAYCDWSRFQEAKAHLHQLGVELVDVPPSTRAGKNAADMRLVIDALELCYAREHINTFVIASGDSDFVPLAAKLRENDRYVIGLGVKQATSPMFVKACDEFVYLDSASRERERERDEPRRPRTESGAPAARKRGEVPSQVRTVVASLLARATGPVNPSFIKEALVRKTPDFDERDFGFSSFSRMLEAMEKEGLLTRIQQGRQWYVTAKDGAPEPRGDEPAERPREERISRPEAPRTDDAPRARPEEEAIPDPDEEG
ncbi:MAG: NYN domain-containing protein [Myxococcaceae bacterium]|nr:NYN domain-containing protein [Myxococcaceae bacterium]